MRNAARSEGKSRSRDSRRERVGSDGQASVVGHRTSNGSSTECQLPRVRVGTLPSESLLRLILFKFIIRE